MCFESLIGSTPAIGWYLCSFLEIRDIGCLKRTSKIFNKVLSFDHPILQKLIINRFGFEGPFLNQDLTQTCKFLIGTKNWKLVQPQEFIPRPNTSYILGQYISGARGENILEGYFPLHETSSEIFLGCSEKKCEEKGVKGFEIIHFKKEEELLIELGKLEGEEARCRAMCIFPNALCMTLQSIKNTEVSIERNFLVLWDLSKHKKIVDIGLTASLFNLQSIGYEVLGVSSKLSLQGSTLFIEVGGLETKNWYKTDLF